MGFLDSYLRFGLLMSLVPAIWKPDLIHSGKKRQPKAPTRTTTNRTIRIIDMLDQELLVPEIVK